ncbi:MAG TPA: acyl-CoA reductase, partial [Bacteroidales bacterium]|nr:acyl-CoA reductase [Bacteroidales bacterium]
MNLEKRIEAFTQLGAIIGQYLSEEQVDSQDTRTAFLHQQVQKAWQENPWFTRGHILEALRSIAALLNRAHLEQWILQYPPLKQDPDPLTIGVVNAGNIPLVGFHDMLCVLMSGHIYYGKLSSKDKHLPRALASILKETEPELQDRIILEENQLKHFDAIIATGSNNTARYF